MKLYSLISRIIHYTLYYTHQFFCCAIFLCTLVDQLAFAHMPTISVIIDDLGSDRIHNQQAIHLPGAFTYAILPNQPYSRWIAELAHQSHKEIMLHLPMQAIKAKESQISGILTCAMNQASFKHTLLNDLAAIPYIHGINNHKGSLLSQNKRNMAWLMETIKASNLYFIDSRTTPLSVAERTAQQYHVPSLRRDVFLDTVLTYQAIDKQFKRLVHIAKTKGYALAIAHPHALTLRYLSSIPQTLANQGIAFVPVSKLIVIAYEQPQRTKH